MATNLTSQPNWANATLNPFQEIMPQANNRKFEVSCFETTILDWITLWQIDNANDESLDHLLKVTFYPPIRPIWRGGGDWLLETNVGFCNEKCSIHQSVWSHIWKRRWQYTIAVLEEKFFYKRNMLTNELIKRENFRRTLQMMSMLDWQIENNKASSYIWECLGQNNIGIWRPTS